MEVTIYLEGIDPIDFFGVNNIRFERIKTHFPGLKILSRGNEVRIKGKEKEVLFLKEKVEEMISYIKKRGELSTDMIDEIIIGGDDSAKNGFSSDKDILLYGENGKPVKARTINQKRLVEECFINDLVMAVGPAGTGKTYTAIALAVRALKTREVRRIILTRPAVEAGEKLGFLPGDYKDKLDPYLQPLYDALNDMIPQKRLKSFMEEGVIQIAPLAYMRGRTLDNAFVILDEAQNATGNQLKMFLTRMGRNAKFIVTGDITQIDLPSKYESGLVIALEVLKNIEGISMVHFDNRDIIRHRLVKYIVDAYQEYGNEEIK